MKNFTQLISESERPVLVDFYADWCGPCKMLAPVLHELATEMGDKVKIIKVDVDKNTAAAVKHGVRGVPTLILFHKGKILWQQAGVLSKAQLQQVLDRHAVA